MDSFTVEALYYAENSQLWSTDPSPSGAGVIVENIFHSKIVSYIPH